MGNVERSTAAAAGSRHPARETPPGRGASTGNRLVVGMGNPLRRDDGIGPRVVEELKKEALPKDVELSVRESDIFELLDELQNRSRVLVVDAVDMGSPPGTVRVFTPREASLQLNADPVSTHGFGLRELVKFAEALSVPADFVIVGIQAGDVSMGENMSPQVETAVNEAVRSIRHLLS